MLAVVGASAIDELFQVIPDELRLKEQLRIPSPLPESLLYSHVECLSRLNLTIEPNRCLAGGGVYAHFIPPVVKEIVHRGEFYTSYTPYQPEVSQGFLQAIFEYQSLICILTGMDAANASSYDGATALVDAVVMAKNATKKRRILIPRFLHPEMKEVLLTYNAGLKLEIVTLATDEGYDVSLGQFEKELKGKEVAGVVFQIPNSLGFYEAQIPEKVELAHKAGALVIMCVYPFVLGVMKSPGRLGADICVGEGQSLGIPLSFGGPYLGFIATKMDFVRLLPGRIIGMANAEGGKRGYVMTLQAREQHIRREKATSSICTNQALMALQAGVYLACVGKDGFHKLSRVCEENAHYAFYNLCKLNGVSPLVPQAPFFNEFPVKLKSAGTVDAVYHALLARGWLAGIRLGTYYPEFSDSLLLAFTELHPKSVIDDFLRDFEEVLR